MSSKAGFALTAAASLVAVGITAFYLISSGSKKKSSRKTDNKKTQESTSRSIDFSAVAAKAEAEVRELKTNGDPGKASNGEQKVENAAISQIDNDKPAAAYEKTVDVSSADATPASSSSSVNKEVPIAKEPVVDSAPVEAVSKAIEKLEKSTKVEVKQVPEKGAVLDSAPVENVSEVVEKLEKVAANDDGKVKKSPPSKEPVVDAPPAEPESKVDEQPETEPESEKADNDEVKEVTAEQPEPVTESDEAKERSVVKDTSSVPGTPDTEAEVTTDDEVDVAKLAKAHAHHKKKPNHSPSKGSAAAAALKELQVSKNKKKKKKKKN
mmetsp:Transcript_13767/g.17968  ORF Transcript_13767/g.17968 Transcript_13767/m.17968 type:complete len:324 (-) Transcript_13767:118-1089(-)|eukprot:CAMPEP_0198146262 /NCGR_PEP_ID=MMETSP1443-20131203/28457_1 /TAXON_ID=186043 /ORGANISM="Entomoneis sp., Strain CCMP2396" /LENGTH=323 /DNA_ID=CAMNT_0043810159 /DNA_START=53 /DNA_END=1024 /DNA_ORIENTATION=+